MWELSGPRILVLVTLVAGAPVGGTAQDAGGAYPFRNPELPIEARIDDLLARMTLDEKIDALSTDPSVPRLAVAGSPHVEGLHGVAQGGPSNWGRRNPAPTTQFPQAVGLGMTWDPDLVRRAAAVEAHEARYLFQSEYDRAGLVVRAPNADLARDIRWGRTEESYGEDPYLAGVLTVAFVEGLQGDDPRYLRTASLMKHFLANSNEDERSWSSSDFDERLLHEYYAVPFRMGIVDGNAQAFMAAYNAVNGIPMHVPPDAGGADPGAVGSRRDHLHRWRRAGPAHHGSPVLPRPCVGRRCGDPGRCRPVSGPAQ